MKKYLLLTLFLIVVIASPVFADGRGRGGAHGKAHHKHAQKYDKRAFHRSQGPYRRVYRARPVYVYPQPYPVYVAPAPVYDYYPGCPPPPPVYYGRPGVRGHVGVDIVF